MGTQRLIQIVGVLQGGETMAPPCVPTLFLYGKLEEKKKRKKMRVKEKHKVRMLQRASCSAEPLS